MASSIVPDDVANGAEPAARHTVPNFDVSGRLTLYVVLAATVVFLAVVFVLLSTGG